MTEVEKKTISLRNKLFFGKSLSVKEKGKISRRLITILKQLDELNEICKKEGEGNE